MTEPVQKRDARTGEVLPPGVDGIDDRLKFSSVVPSEVRLVVSVPLSIAEVERDTDEFWASVREMVSEEVEKIRHRGVFYAREVSEEHGLMMAVQLAPPAPAEPAPMEER